MKILLIEDEGRLARPLIKILQRHNFIVEWKADGITGLEEAYQEGYACIVLDLNLPGKDGLMICQQLRKEDINTPILMLTARSSQVDKIKGLQYGADDYMVKPFNSEELVLRIKALIRRNSIYQSVSFEYQQWTFYPEKLQVIKDRKSPVELSKKEAAVLEYLWRHQGQPISAEELLEHVWDQEVNIFTQTVKTHIKTLRQKIDPQKRLIQTVRGAGYVLGRELKPKRKSNEKSVR